MRQIAYDINISAQSFPLQMFIFVIELTWRELSLEGMRGERRGSEIVVVGGTSGRVGSGVGVGWVGLVPLWLEGSRGWPTRLLEIIVVW